MLADQLSDLQAYAGQRTAELGIEPGHVPARVPEFLKGRCSGVDRCVETLRSKSRTYAVGTAETLGLDLLKIRRTCRNTDHRNQVTAAHHYGR